MKRALACGLAAALASAACSSDTTAPAGTTNPDASADGKAGSGGGSSTGGKGGAGGKGGTGTGTGGTAGTGGAGGTAGTAGADGGDAGNGPVQFTGTTTAYVGGKNGAEAPLAGVTVCVVDATGKKSTTIPCATTNAKGEYSFTGLARKQTLIILFEKAGYATQIIAADIGTADANRSPLRLALTAAADAGVDAGAGFASWDPALVIDPAKGSLNAFAVQPGPGNQAAPGYDFTTGVSFTITPAAGAGPYYIDPTENWVSGATKTVGGWGAWFQNLTPGTYTVKATSATLSCTAIPGNGFGWAQADGSAKAPVFKGMNTQSIGFLCTPPAVDAGTKP